MLLSALVCLSSLATAGALGSLAGFVNALYMPVGGYLSDLIGHYKGMRGRLWFTTVVMAALGLFLILLSKTHENLTLSIIAMQLLLAAIAIYAAALFTLTPFISHRALGLVQGIVGSGASIIGSVLQELLFNKSRSVFLLSSTSRRMTIPSCAEWIRMKGSFGLASRPSRPPVCFFQSIIQCGAVCCGNQRQTPKRSTITWQSTLKKRSA